VGRSIPVWVKDFSKEFLTKLIQFHAAGYSKLGEFWFERVSALVGVKKAMMEDAVGVWINQPYFINPKVAKAAGIEVKCVVDVLKAWQIILEGFLRDRYVPEFESKGPNYVIMSHKSCLDLLYMQEMNMTGRIKYVCGARGVEELTMIAYVQSLLSNG